MGQLFQCRIVLLLAKLLLLISRPREEIRCEISGIIICDYLTTTRVLL